MIDLHDVTDSPNTAASSGARALVKRLGVRAGELHKALSAAQPSIGSSLLSLLTQASRSAESEVLGRLLPIFLANGPAPFEVIRRLLLETNIRELAVAGADAAVALQEDELIGVALQHPRADARQIALEQRLSQCNGVVPAELLTFATDRGSRVRRALLDKVALWPHPTHIETLLKLSKDRWSDAEPHYDEPDSYPIARAALEALSRYEAVDDAIGNELIDLAVETADAELARTAFAVAAARSGPSVRDRILQVSSNRTLNWKRVYALQGLTAAPMVEQQLLERLPDQWVRSVAPPVAVAGIELLCTHLPLAEAAHRLEAVSHSNSRRALILVGAHTLRRRDEKAAMDVLGLLEPAHPARQLFTGVALPRSILNDLGRVQVRRYVEAFLSEYMIDERSKTADRQPPLG